jgi:hypothetical protein
MEGLVGMGVLIDWLHEKEKGRDLSRERVRPDPWNVFYAGFPERPSVDRIHLTGGRDRYVWLELEKMPSW